MVQVVGIPQIFRILVNATTVVQKSGSVDHERDFRNVELVKFSEWCKYVDGFSGIA